MKRIFLSALLIAGAMSSCSKNEIVDKAPTANDNLDIIGVEIAAAATRGTETTADLIRTSGIYESSTNENPLTLAFYATHWDATYSNSDEDTTAAVNVATGSISFYYDGSAWYQTAYSSTEGSVSGSALSESGATSDDLFPVDDELLWGNMSIGEEGANGETPTAYFFALHDGTKSHDLAAPVLDGESYRVTCSADSGNPAFTQEAGFTGGTITTQTLKDQVDLVYYAGEISAFPTGGNIRGTFYHALSRLEMYSSQGDYTPYVKSITLVNVLKGGTPTLIYGTDDAEESVEWALGTLVSGDASASYLNELTNYQYYNNVDAKTNNTSTAEDFGLQTGGTGMADGKILAKAISNEYYSTVDNNIMMVPQTLAAPDATSVYANAILLPSSSTDFSSYDYTDITSTYVAMIYRMTTVVGSGTNAEDASVVGYKYAIDCPEFLDMYNDYKNDNNTSYDLGVYNLYNDDTAIITNKYGTRFDGTSLNSSNTYFTTTATASISSISSTNPYLSDTATEKSLFETIMSIDSNLSALNKQYLSELVTEDMGLTPVSHLYMLVGFPIGVNGATLSDGKHYNFNLQIGTTGGILLHPYYVDAYGRSTKIPINDVEVGDYVLATAESPIGITITVQDWDDSANKVDL